MCPLTSGLVSEEGEDESRELATKYLSKPQTLILFCMSAGAEPNTKTPDVQLVLENDPALQRTMSK